MKKGSASLVVLSVIFLLTALLIYLFEYVSIERTMYTNRSKMKQYAYNEESVHNIITKDIQETYLNGGDIHDIIGKNYSVFENQKAIVSLNDPTAKNAINIYYEEKFSNKKEKTTNAKYSLLNRIFFKDNPSAKEKKDFCDEIIQNNEVQNFSTSEINNYYIDIEDIESRNFDYGNGNAIVKIMADEDLNANINGSGIMIIDGDVSVKANFKFRGLLIINGSLNIEGESDIMGALIDIDKGSNIDCFKSLNTMYRRCKTFKGIIKVTRSNY
ncbi:hypothetical protein [uncultured Fenollaria sp.]|uniref:hypothetical protein n=1 Tax=uncultured Fenollaria sp. TaxID=1686315 RepID=UPI0025EA8232|nr:hypothetical protein [uncultured Fenollaria sp.]